MAVYRVQDNETSDRFDRINNNHILFGSLLNPPFTIIYIYKNDGNVIILCLVLLFIVFHIHICIYIIDNGLKSNRSIRR